MRTTRSLWVPWVGGAVIGLVSGILPVSAQDAGNPFIGQWTVTWEGQKKPLQADLEITATGGRWQTASSSRSDPCVGREGAIEGEPKGPDEMTFTVKLSVALTGCKDFRIHLRREADGKITGRRGEAELTLTRR